MALYIYIYVYIYIYIYKRLQICCKYYPSMFSFLYQFMVGFYASIRVASHKCHGISNDRKFDCLCSSLFGIITTKSSNICVTGPLWWGIHWWQLCSPLTVLIHHHLLLRLKGRALKYLETDPYYTVGDHTWPRTWPLLHECSSWNFYWWHKIVWDGKQR